MNKDIGAAFNIVRVFLNTHNGGTKESTAIEIIYDAFDAMQKELSGLERTTHYDSCYQPDCDYCKEVSGE